VIHLAVLGGYRFQADHHLVVDNPTTERTHQTLHVLADAMKKERGLRSRG